MSNIKVVLHKRGLSYPRGYKVAGLHCGIKKSGKKDLGLLFSEESCKSCGVFTQNKVKAHPVILSQKNLRSKSSKAIFINSGNANCLNGKQGYDAAKRVLKGLSEQLNIKTQEIIISSTGIIGELLPVNKILKNLPELSCKLDKGRQADIEFAESITTTDTKLKFAACQIDIKGKKVRIAGVAKGSGMIKPHMATMLAFFSTDAVIEQRLLDSVFKDCVDRTFNRINIDGQTSTNDMAIIFANGLAGNEEIKKHSSGLEKFKLALFELCEDLSYQVVQDAEGVTKVVKINLKGVKNKKDIKCILDSVSESMLVKTFIYGEKPNWGRILQAIGKTDVKFNTSKVEVFFDGLLVFKRNKILKEKSSESRKKLKKQKVDITINLNQGNKQDSILTCDLTPEYVKINSKY